MAWRNQSTHGEETKMVKAALQRLGVPVKSVGHGRGTAWGWLEINIGANPGGMEHDPLAQDEYGRCVRRYSCPACRANNDMHDKAENIAREVTGRGAHGTDDRILVLTQD